MIPYFFYGSGMYRKHQNHAYGRNRNNSANNRAIVGLFFWQFSTLYVALMFIFSSSKVLDKSLLSLSKTMERGQRVSQRKNITTLLCYASFFTEASTPTYQGEIMTFVYFLTSRILDNEHEKIVGDNQDCFYVDFWKCFCML